MLPQIRTYRPGSAIRLGAGDGSDWLRLFDETFDRDMTGRTGWSAWTPAADLYETDDQFVLEMGLPGYDAESVDVTVERGVLTIAGAREATEEVEERQYHVREHSYARFARSFTLPSSVVVDDVVASFEQGMLTVRLPKVPEAKPLRIPVAQK